MKPGFLARLTLVPLRFIGYHLGFGLRRGWEAACPAELPAHPLDPRRR